MVNIPAPRLLPTAILAMGVLLAVRVAELGGIGPSHLAPVAARGAASLMHTTLLPPAQAASSGQLPSPATLNPGMGHARRPAESEREGNVPQAGVPAPASPQFVDPGASPTISAAERQLLEDLRARRLTLDAREQEIAQREAVLSAAERRLSQRVEELTAMQTRLEALDRAAREREEANWVNLVRIYENMRPRDAARIFNELEMSVLLEVVARMKQRTVAPILAGMEPDRAQRVTTELAGRQGRRTGGG